ncbi:MAG: hypothetical protein ACYCX4_03845 [Bacillota bacterium]
MSGGLKPGLALPESGLKELENADLTEQKGTIVLGRLFPDGSLMVIGEVIIFDDQDDEIPLKGEGTD